MNGDDTDSLPTHREVGQQLVFPYADKMWTGEVVAVKDVLTCLIEAEGEVFYERGNDITHLFESAACVHCGQYAFLCSDECPGKSPKPTRPMKTPTKMTLAQVIELPPKTYIDGCFDCIVTVETMFDKKTGAPYFKAKLVESTDPKISIAAKFWGDADISGLNGKLVEFVGSGLQRTEYQPQKGKPIQQVSISDAMKDGTPTHNWRIIGESAHADKPLPHPPSTTRDTPATNPTQPSPLPVQGNGNLTDVARRAACYFKVLFEVEQKYEDAKAQGLKLELAPTDIKDITTHLSMTYRGDYGSYMEPVFEGHHSNGTALSQLPDQKWEADPAKTAWKAFIHPVSKKPLGELDDGTLAKAARWAVNEKPAPALKDLHTAVLDMAADKGWDASNIKLLVASFINDSRYEQPDGFGDQDLIDFFGISFDDMGEDFALDYIRKFDPNPKLKHEGVIETMIRMKETNEAVPF